MGFICIGICWQRGLFAKMKTKGKGEKEIGSTTRSARVRPRRQKGRCCWAGEQALEMISNELALPSYKERCVMLKRYLDKGLGDLAVLVMRIKSKKERYL